MSRMGLLAFLSDEDLSSACIELVSTLRNAEYHWNCDGWVDGLGETNFFKDFADGDGGRV